MCLSQAAGGSVVSLVQRPDVNTGVLLYTGKRERSIGKATV